MTELLVTGGTGMVGSAIKKPQEVPLLLGDASKAKEKLDWEPKVKFKTLCHLMYEADLDKEIGL